MARKTAPVAEKPVATKAAKEKASTWGISDLAEYVNAQTGSDFDGYNLRIVLRKLAKDGQIERGEGRYSFTGAKDPAVVAIVKAIKSGAAEKAKTERLAGLKEKKAAGNPATTTKGRTKKAAPVVEDEDEDLLEDLDDDDE